ncbi:restriction endonuclease [Streptomyces diacarni]|uniref:restriction endonuclease n=1 Tax=Streptomyces diacarni TaxID=2800381 RepID=UPI0033C06B8A
MHTRTGGETGEQARGRGAPPSDLLADSAHRFARFLADADVGPVEGGQDHEPDAATAGAHTVLHDPDGRIEAELPLDREAHERLAAAVLAWDGTSPACRKCDAQQIALLLTGAARAVTADVRHAAHRLPADSDQRMLATYLLAEADRRLSAPLSGTVRSVQGHARLLRALYDQLDRLGSLAPPAA